MPMKKILWLLVICVTLSSCTSTYRFLVNTPPSINDHNGFPTNVINKSDNPFKFFNAAMPALPNKDLWVDKNYDQNYPNAETYLAKNYTSAFMVIRNDSILYENYFNNYAEDIKTTLFSVSKSFTTVLVGIALKEGYLKSSQQKVAEFIPEFNLDERKNITIEHLLQMTSGLAYEDMSKKVIDLFKLGTLYNTADNKKFVAKAKLAYTPGEHFAYKSIDTEILGICLEKAIGRSVSEYLQEKIWNPLGMEFDALFTLDHKQGMERTYGGLAACSRDLAKFGRLMLNKGNWNGVQIVPENWVNKIITSRADTTHKWWGYSTGWWLDTYITQNISSLTDFYAAGYNGQFIYINPEKNLIIIRQGEKWKGSTDWVGMIARLGDLLCGTNPKLPDQFAFNSINGKYQAENGDSINISIKQKNNICIANGTNCDNLEFKPTSPISMFNRKKQRRIILEKNSTQINGIYLDNLHDKLQFYKKVK